MPDWDPLRDTDFFLVLSMILKMKRGLPVMCIVRFILREAGEVSVVRPTSFFDTMSGTIDFDLASVLSATKT